MVGRTRDFVPERTRDECGDAGPKARAAPEGWTLAQAVDVCRAVEAICPEFGCHVALTGGCLYKDGERKDLDILFYRIRQVEEVDKDGLFEALRAIGLEHVRGFGWCHKATFDGRAVDCFFPDEDGEYPPKEDSLTILTEAPDREVVF